MKEQIENLVNRLEDEINNTPTSELRNLLTDANVLLQALSIHVVSNRISDSGLRELYRKGYNDGFDNKADDKLATDLIDKRTERIKKNYGC